jgi:hypothetical protein
VYTTKGRLVEAPQEVHAPVIEQRQYVWWGWTWHMQTPIENLTPGSFATVRIQNQVILRQGEWMTMVERTGASASMPQPDCQKTQSWPCAING